MGFYLENSNFFGTLKRKCCLAWGYQFTSYTRINNLLMILRFVLTLSIFLPTLAVYAHELSHHEHQECEKSSVHFHEHKENCCLDNFLVIKIYSLSLKNYKSLVLLFNLEIFEIESLNQKEFLINFFKRGPPSN